jgi:hypothetical protein
MKKTWKSFLDNYGNDTTNNFQLEKYAKDLGIPNFNCLMRDELNDLSIENLPLNIIINLHTSNQKGVHWSMISVPNIKKAYYFDSYGLPPTKEVKSFLKPIKNKICSTFKLQDFDDKYCGIMCLYILDQLNNNNNFVNIVTHIFTSKNE